MHNTPIDRQRDRHTATPSARSKRREDLEKRKLTEMVGLRQTGVRSNFWHPATDERFVIIILTCTSLKTGNL